ncbi:hypothetical protein Ahy_B10g103801 isoform H [Arachis hypogaea]|uniref:Uncharacterized protein n=1 Tax=Arachis hypogaea TaxID=3818 RepID=A0A444X472_ARAHY|nr:hypothetical protein Ahy_B10g103801 isoform H [Arachis hypogaea]
MIEIKLKLASETYGLKERGKMGYVLRVRMASFFSGAAIASFAGFYILHRDYKIAHESFANQMKNLHESLDSRISALEKLRQTENSKQVEASE